MKAKNSSLTLQKEKIYCRQSHCHPVEIQDSLNSNFWRWNVLLSVSTIPLQFKRIWYFQNFSPLCELSSRVSLPSRRVNKAVFQYLFRVIFNKFSAVKMKFSWSFVVSGVFIGYICYSMWTFAQLFRSLSCSDQTTCFQSFLNSNPKMQLALFTSPSVTPISSEVKKLANIRNFDYREPYTRFD